MANLAALGNSISDSITGIGAALGILPDFEPQFFPPDYWRITSDFQEDAWNELPEPYTFAVVDIVSLNPWATTDFEDFGLPIAPNKISQTEQFAVSIKATQGGSVTTHSGNKFKKLVIEGTTGISPFRGMTGVKGSDGRVFAKPNKLKYKSGHHVFILLRDYFRTYYEQKAGGQSAGFFGATSSTKDWRLVFKNYKDGEFLIVELLDFTMDRSAERSFLYDYKMEFKVLGNTTFYPIFPSFLDLLDALLEAANEAIQLARAIFLTLQSLMRSVESSYNSTVLEPLRQINLAAKAAAGAIITAGDVGNRILKNTVTGLQALDILKTIKADIDASKSGQNTSLAPSLLSASIPADLTSTSASETAVQALIDLGPALLDLPSSVLPTAAQTALDKEIENVSNLPKSFYEDTIKALERVKSNAEDQFNLGDPDFDELFDRTATNVAEDSKQVTIEEFDLLGAFNSSIENIEALITSPTLFKTPLENQTEFMQDKFSDDLGLQSLPTVKQIAVPIDTDLEQIALEHMGNPQRWPEIAELNDLRAPFIVQDRSEKGTNTLAPGDKLLIPNRVTFGLNDMPVTKEIPATAGMNEVEKNLGVDLKLTENMDLALGNNGDLEVIAGAANMGQAIVLKVGYEQGELKNHPGLGVGLMIGEKFLPLGRIRDNMIGTLTRDARINRIENVSLLREGPAMYMQFDVLIKQLDTPVPMKVRL